jgi:prepilin-type N-terminal cleavage/methylation domain-containing protein
MQRFSIKKEECRPAEIFGRGFTMLEFLVVISLTGILAFLLVPWGVDILRRASFFDASENLKSVLHKARIQAMTQRHDSAFGVRLEPDRFILFEGASYATRNSFFDEEYLFPTGMVWTGPAEIVFAEFSGLPVNPGVLTLSSGGISRLMTISGSGRIDLD